MSSIPLPLRQYPGYQEDLIWWAMESDGALGRKSSQGAIQARLEGGSGVHIGYDLLEDPHEALLEITRRAGFRAAGRLKSIERAWRLCSTLDQETLAAVYWTPLHPGLEAFGRLGNVVPLSDVAHYRHKLARVRMTFGEWVTRLSARYVIFNRLQRDPKQVRQVPREFTAISLINNDCELKLTRALENYAEARRRVNISGGMTVEHRHRGRPHR